MGTPPPMPGQAVQKHLAGFPSSGHTSQTAARSHQGHRCHLEWDPGQQAMGKDGAGVAWGHRRVCPFAFHPMLAGVPQVRRSRWANGTQQCLGAGRATSATSPVHLDCSKVLPAPKTGPSAKLLSTPQAKKVRGNIQLITNYKSLPYPDLLC